MFFSVFISALSSVGRLFTFGENERGQLGHGDMESRTKATMVELLRDIKIVNVSCGTSHVGVVSGMKRNFLVFFTSDS